MEASMTRVFALALFVAAAPAAAQTIPPRAAADIIGGYAGFVDDATIDHAVIGGSVRLYLSPRISLGPELVYMRGPAGDRDLFLTGNLTVDLLAPRPGRRLVPFLTAGGGLMRHTERVGTGPYTSGEGAVTGGGGARVWLSDRMYLLGEVRLGWEPHYRADGGFGFAW
jgi:hypothetical protein